MNKAYEIREYQARAATLLVRYNDMIIEADRMKKVTDNPRLPSNLRYQSAIIRDSCLETASETMLHRDSFLQIVHMLSQRKA